MASRIICFLLCFCVLVTDAVSEDRLSEEQKILVEKLVSLSGEMEEFQRSVKEYHRDFISIHIKQMFVGTVLEDDPKAVLTIKQAIDDAIDWEFTEGDGLKRVHYRSFGLNNSEQELEDIIEFYQTDIGRKVLNANAGMFKEWENNRNIWAKSLHSTIRRKVKVRLEEYYEKRLEEVNTEK